MFLFFSFKLVLWVVGFIKIEWESVRYNVGFIKGKKVKEKNFGFLMLGVYKDI